LKLQLIQSIGQKDSDILLGNLEVLFSLPWMQEKKKVINEKNFKIVLLLN